jgi:molybdopterin-guanine dinucleotide biosynthesis protein A
MNNITGAFLIGGKSKRFGRDKVVYPIGREVLSQKAIDIVKTVAKDIILIGHPRKELSHYKTVEDLVPGSGPLGGIYTALSVAKTEYVFVFAADMPFLNIELIKHMATLAGDHDIIIPSWSNGTEPLHAIYRKTLTSPIKSMIEKKHFKIDRISEVEGISILKVTEDIVRTYGDPKKIFHNVNTLKDLEMVSNLIQ